MTTEERSDRRERILDSAVEEFAEHGLSGARVDRIASRAGANKQLIYYYFGDKAGLFDAAVRVMTVRMEQVRAALPERPADRLTAYFDGALADQDLIRMLQWEALETGSSGLVDEERRASYMRAGVEALRRDQEAGVVPADLDAAQLFLSFQALASHPFAFPQMARLVTGLDPNDPDFVAARRHFLDALGERLFGSSAG